MDAARLGAGTLRDRAARRRLVRAGEGWYRSAMQQPWRYDRAELIADGVVHVIGVVFGIIAATAIVIAAFWLVEPSAAVAATLYALTLVASLGISAAYNMWPVGPLKWRLRRFDHAAIFGLIAGTYTPFALHMATTGAWLLAAVWSAALAGMALKLACPGRYDRAAILLYLALGWSGFLIFDTAVASLDPVVVALIVAGGITYSAGVVFHVWTSLRFQNAIWHVFVLAGAMVHYAAVLRTVVVA